MYPWFKKLPVSPSPPACSLQVSTRGSRRVQLSPLSRSSSPPWGAAAVMTSPRPAPPWSPPWAPRTGSCTPARCWWRPDWATAHLETCSGGWWGEGLASTSPRGRFASTEWPSSFWKVSYCFVVCFFFVIFHGYRNHYRQKARKFFLDIICIAKSIRVLQT